MQKGQKEVERDMDVRRRDFLTGALRPRNLVRACTGAFAWTHLVEEARMSGDLAAPAPETPEWQDGMDSVLEQLNDWTGIEDP
jgi:hypothetical protein